MKQSVPTFQTYDIHLLVSYSRGVHYTFGEMCCDDLAKNESKMSISDSVKM